MIINSLLDTDLYKFTMMQVVFHHFADAEVEYEFICRTKGIDFTPYAEKISEEIDHLCTLRLSEDELNYMRQLGYFSEDFLQWLGTFQLNPEHIKIQDRDHFRLTIKGPWLHTILFEVPVLAIISELYHGPLLTDPDMSVGKKHLEDKIHYLQNAEMSPHIKFVDFGTRRRLSYQWHDYVIRRLKEALPNNFTGTSNVMLAKQYDLKPVGTMAHEYLQACQQLASDLETSEQFGFYKWIQEYGNKLAIALSDVYNRYVFVNDLNFELCRKFHGFRQDSGDPYSWGDLVIEHLKDQGIDPKEKSLVFSDSLDFEKMANITQYFYQRTTPLFGIGTYLTNDVGIKPVEIIIKMVACNGKPVGKLTDDPRKTVCPDEDFLKTLQNTFGYYEDARQSG